MKKDKGKKTVAVKEGKNQMKNKLRVKKWKEEKNQPQIESKSTQNEM